MQSPMLLVGELDVDVDVVVVDSLRSRNKYNFVSLDETQCNNIIIKCMFRNNITTTNKTKKTQPNTIANKQTRSDTASSLSDELHRSCARRATQRHRHCRHVAAIVGVETVDADIVLLTIVGVGTVVVDVVTLTVEGVGTGVIVVVVVVIAVLDAVEIVPLTVVDVEIGAIVVVVVVIAADVVAVVVVAVVVVAIAVCMIADDLPTIPALRLSV